MRKEKGKTSGVPIFGAFWSKSRREREGKEEKEEEEVETVGIAKRKKKINKKL